jgi:hypothetical protein
MLVNLSKFFIGNIFLGNQVIENVIEDFHVKRVVEIFDHSVKQNWDCFDHEEVKQSDFHLVVFAWDVFGL